MSNIIPETAGKTYTGGCHCGAINFKATGPMRPIVACHCTDCLRLAGYSWAATTAAHDKFEITKGSDNLDWYHSSDIAKRGFCKTCHAQLFYQLHNLDRISISPGMLDNLDGLYISGQIYRNSLPEDCHITSDTPNIDDKFEP